jgi:hypothetical protein
VTQLYRTQPGASPSSDTDVIIYGSGISVYWTNTDEIIPDRLVVGYVYYVYLGTTVTNQNLIQEEIKRRLNSGNACYHSV